MVITVLIFDVVLCSLDGLSNTSLAEEPYEDAAVVEAYALVNLSAEQGAKRIREFFDLNGSANVAFDVVPDSRTNSLIIAGSPRTQERIIQVLEEIDVIPAQHAVLEDAQFLRHTSKTQARVVIIENVNCKEVAHQVRSLFESSEGMHKISWFSPANAVLLRSTAAEIEQMAAIISEIDLPTVATEDAKAVAPETEIIHLEHADAVELADVVSRYGRPLDGRRRKGAGPLLVLVEERLNSLILKGPRAAVVEAKALIAQLDVKPVQALAAGK